MPQNTSDISDSNMDEADSASSPPLIPSVHRPTRHQLHIEIARRAKQARFMLVLQDELERRRALRCTTDHNVDIPTRDRYNLRSRQAGGSTTPASASPPSTTLSPECLSLTETVRHKNEVEAASLPSPVILSGLTMVQRRWLVQIRLYPDQMETDWGLVALLFEDTFEKVITPSIAKAASDFLSRAVQLKDRVL